MESLAFEGHTLSESHRRPLGLWGHKRRMRRRLPGGARRIVNERGGGGGGKLPEACRFLGCSSFFPSVERPMFFCFEVAFEGGVLAFAFLGLCVERGFGACCFMPCVLCPLGVGFFEVCGGALGLEKEGSKRKPPTSTRTRHPALSARSKGGGRGDLFCVSGVCSASTSLFAGGIGVCGGEVLGASGAWSGRALVGDKGRFGEGGGLRGMMYVGVSLRGRGRVSCVVEPVGRESLGRGVWFSCGCSSLGRSRTSPD